MTTLLEVEKTWQEAAHEKARVSPLASSVVGRYLLPLGRPPIFRREYLFAALLPVRDLRVLELGCGEGHTSRMLALAGAHVTAVDLSETAINRANTQDPSSYCHFVAAPAQEFLSGAEAGQFDLVLADSFLHHVLADLPSVLAGVRRSLKPGGRAIFVEPLALSPAYRKFRRLFPKREDVSPDERPLEADQVEMIRSTFSFVAATLFDLSGRLVNRLPHAYETAPVLEKMLQYGTRRFDWLVLNQLGWARSWAGYGVFVCWK